MSRAILYSTYFILTLGVILSLLVSFKIIKIDKNSDINTQQEDKLVDLSDSYQEIELKNSWLYEVGKENKKKSYIFAQTQIVLELN